MRLKTTVVKTADSCLGFDAKTGRLVSFRPASAPDMEFILSRPEHPAWVVQYLDGKREHQELTSRQAAGVTMDLERADGRTTLVFAYRRISGLDLDVTMRVSAATTDPLCRWRITVRNGAGIEITDAQFPFVVCPYKLAGTAGSECLILPHFYGRLMTRPDMARIGPDFPAIWQISSPPGGSQHYPGGHFAQFLAFYNDRAGLYLACEDSEGNVKRFQAAHREPGMRLGVGHVGDWPSSGERTLEYDTVLGSFTGDWHDAADKYRDWSLKQKWGKPLHQRTDIPGWLLESPPYITIRPQGVLDAGPVFPVKEFLPYEKCIPMLERIAKKVDSPLVAVLMGWERAASWVYPDCFPPIGGDASIKRFAAMARKRGWRTGSFCNGTRWIISHSWNSYDGRRYYEENRGADGVCRLPDGRPWMDDWYWRNSYLACMGTESTRRIATDFVKRLLGWGMESIQFFDQNCGAPTFPCYARDHEHAPVPGKWMACKMEELIMSFRQAAAEAGKKGIIHSVEMCCNEYNLQLFQESDSRLVPPGHMVQWDRIPLYQYLFHECIVMQGHMGHAPEPHYQEIHNACNGVMGEIPGGVMTGDGTLLDKDTENWGDWDPKLGDDECALRMIRTVTAMRRGPGRDFLVYGRMQKPCGLGKVKTVTWEHDGRPNAIDAIFHACWTAPDGRHAVALANWTAEEQTCLVRDPRLGSDLTEHTAGRTVSSRGRKVVRGSLRVVVPPLGMVLIEEAACAATAGVNHGRGA